MINGSTWRDRNARTQLGKKSSCIVSLFSLLLSMIHIYKDFINIVDSNSIIYLLYMNQDKQTVCSNIKYKQLNRVVPTPNVSFSLNFIS